MKVALALYSATFLPHGPQWPVVTLLRQVGRSWVSDSQVPGLMSKLLWRVSKGWWLLRLPAKILALLRLSVNFFQLRLTKFNN